MRENAYAAGAATSSAPNAPIADRIAELSRKRGNCAELSTSLKLSSVGLSGIGLTVRTRISCALRNESESTHSSGSPKNSSTRASPT